MDIYIVSHYYNNGESYEDYREGETHEFYSSFEKASKAFWNYVCDNYEGKFVLIRKTLDTQEAECLEESVWIKCSPWYCQEEWQGEYEPEYDPEDYYPDPMESYREYWRWDDDTSYDDISEEEDKVWFEYVTTPGTNYQEWEEVNKEIEERKKAILFEELNEMLKELC